MGGDWRSYPSPLVAAVRLPRRDGEQEGGTEEMEREREREGEKDFTLSHRKFGRMHEVLNNI